MQPHQQEDQELDHLEYPAQMLCLDFISFYCSFDWILYIITKLKFIWKMETAKKNEEQSAKECQIAIAKIFELDAIVQELRIVVTRHSDAIL